MFFIGTLISFIKPKQMSQVRVTECKEREPSWKYTERESDGYIYKLEYDDPKQPPKYVFLSGYVETLFKPNPPCRFVNQEFIEYLNEKAKKDGNKGYNAVDHLHLMKDFPLRKGHLRYREGPAPYTDEQLSPDELKAMQAFEIARAEEHVKKCGGGPECHRPFYIKAKAKDATSAFPTAALI